MHYEEYCKTREMHQNSPLAADNFYQGLHQITLKRAMVLAEIEQTAVKRLV